MLVLLAALALERAGAPLLAEPPAAPGFTAADYEFFEKKVRPVLFRRCYTCHSTKAKKVRGGLLLDSRAALLRGGDSGPAAVAGQPDKSLLLKAISYRDERLQMPPKGKLPPREIALLTEWVRRGLPFPDSAPTLAARKSIDLAAGRRFWSFQPLKTQPLPATRDGTWAAQCIDAFVLAELERHGLAPSPRAERRTLIRRACFDLIGLPPTPAEIDAFVNDPRPDAYVRLVERLLASPRYGERWGRFWLDLTRYSDIPEPWMTTKAKAHLYRDWVVQALNEDLPYDRFVQLQLAADQMPEARPTDRAALGFLGLSPTYWKELKLDKDVIKTVVAEEWEDRIHTVCSTFLGLTVACARCHDHKFDPISTEDYYALAGVFASTKAADQSLLPAAVAARAQQARDRIAALKKQIDGLWAKKPAPPNVVQQIIHYQAEIEWLKQTPGFDMPPAYGVEDASLYVLPDGPHRTKLEYRKGPQDVAVQIRGNPASLGPVVPRRFVTVLCPDTPKPFQQGSGRLELARAITREGGPLAARVIVNRVWKHHFGVGLVDTPDDFGHEGARPSHPQLLDDLAARFVAAGWSLKWLHREIMLSATYRQSSGHNARKLALDPDNRWLWRMNRRRLEVEAWRDAVLAVSGSLEDRLGGPPSDLADANNRRRTLYGTVKRRDLNDLLRLYDFPDPIAHSPGRTPTTTPLQQLYVLNSPFVAQQSLALARRLQQEGSVEGRVRRAYVLLFGRAATDKEVKLAREFLTTGKSGDAVPETVWQQYAQVLLGSNEFLFVD
jgi:hypothetical protein